MRTVWKFQLPFNDWRRFEIDTPEQFNVLQFGMQGASPTIWAEVDTDSPTVRREFHRFGTGAEIPATGQLRYVGTYGQGPYVWHVYAQPTRSWVEHAGGDRPDNVPDVNVDIERKGQEPWTGPAAVADWSTACRYRISDDQPDQA